jgi:streptogramin lyase
MNGIFRAVVTAVVVAALLVGPGQAFAAFPGTNGELLFDAAVDADFDGVGTAMIGTLDPATGVPTMLTEGSDSRSRASP